MLDVSTRTVNVSQARIHALASNVLGLVPIFGSQSLQTTWLHKCLYGKRHTQKNVHVHLQTMTHKSKGGTSFHSFCNKNIKWNRAHHRSFHKFTFIIAPRCLYIYTPENTIVTQTMQQTNNITWLLSSNLAYNIRRDWWPRDTSHWRRNE